MRRFSGCIWHCAMGILRAVVDCLMVILCHCGLSSCISKAGHGMQAACDAMLHIKSSFSPVKAVNRNLRTRTCSQRVPDATMAVCNQCHFCQRKSRSCDVNHSLAWYVRDALKITGSSANLVV